MSSLKLFRCHNEIVDHPTNLPADPLLIKEGPVAGWEVYASGWGRHNGVLGPFLVNIARWHDGSLVIELPDEQKTQYFFHNDDGKPHWYQSGNKLLFVRTRPEY